MKAIKIIFTSVPAVSRPIAPSPMGSGIAIYKLTSSKGKSMGLILQKNF